MSLVSGEKSNFQFILRLLNTNVRHARNSCKRGGFETMDIGQRLKGKKGQLLMGTLYRSMASKRSCTP